MDRDRVDPPRLGSKKATKDEVGKKGTVIRSADEDVPGSSKGRGRYDDDNDDGDGDGDTAREESEGGDGDDDDDDDCWSDHFSGGPEGPRFRHVKLSSNSPSSSPNSRAFVWGPEHSLLASLWVAVLAGVGLVALVGNSLAAALAVSVVLVAPLAGATRHCLRHNHPTWMVSYGLCVVATIELALSVDSPYVLIPVILFYVVIPVTAPCLYGCCYGCGGGTGTGGAAVAADPHQLYESTAIDEVELAAGDNGAEEELRGGFEMRQHSAATAPIIPALAAAHGEIA